MYLRTLGGLELEGAAFPRPKLLLLLAYLTLEGPRDRHHLAELFWQGAAEPMTSVRVALQQLRRGVPDAIVLSGARVEAVLDTDASDFLNLLEAGKVQNAKTLYRGGFLEGLYLREWSVELEEWVYATREFLATRLRSALLVKAEAEACKGDFERGAEWAEAAYRVRGASEPEPEMLSRLHRLLIAVDSSSVSELKREARDYDLELRLTHDEARAHFRSASHEFRRHNLPVRYSSFVGRDLELLELAGLIAKSDTRLITLTGPGGVGKTRLALQVAQQELRQETFTDGVFVVPLDALGDPALIPGSIATVLGFALSGDVPPLVGLTAALAQRQLLLILDNYEHLLAGTEIVASLLQECSDLKLLVTSRERLGLGAEQLYRVEGLPLGAHGLTLEAAQHQDALRLFVERAKRVQLEFALTQENLPAVQRLCHVLNGSPLGIELAAACIRFLSPTELALELEKNLDVLTSDRKDISERQRSLRAAFDYSWQLLKPDEQAVLRKLSVFVGGFTRAAAARVADATIPQLASLVDKSLLRLLEDGRYDRHPLLYSYTQEKLAYRLDELHSAQAKHAIYYFEVAQQAEAEHRGSRQRYWLSRLETEHDNVRAALEWALQEGDAALSLELAVSMYHFWYYRSHFTEGRGWLERVISATEKGAPALESWRARALHAAGVLADEAGDYAQATALFEARLTLAEKIGDTLGQAIALNSLGIMATERQDYARAYKLLDASLALRRALGQSAALAHPLCNLGIVAIAQNAPERAQGYLEESLALSREADDSMGVASCLTNLAATFVDTGDPASAQTHLEEALELFLALGDRDGIASCLEGFAAVATQHESMVAAAHLCGAAAALRERVKSPLSPSDAERHERRTAAARLALGDERFAACWDEGRNLSPDDALKVARMVADTTVQPDCEKRKATRPN